jgi:hypothetical protein
MRRTIPTCSSSQPARTTSSFASTSFALALSELAARFAPRSFSISVAKLPATLKAFGAWKPLLGSVRSGRRLTGSVVTRQDGHHENTTLSSNHFHRGVDRPVDCLRNHADFRPGCAHGHLDEPPGNCLDNQCRGYISCRGYEAKDGDLGHLYGRRRHCYNSGNTPINRDPQILQRSRRL